MIVRKEKQYLVFDFEDGTNVKYDLARKITIGKKGKPVLDLKSQLSGYSIADILQCCEDPNYARFLQYVERSERKISNIGTILERSKQYAHCEQIFSAGIQKLDKYFQYGIKDIPAGLLKICREYNLRLTNEAVEVYKTHPDLYTLGFSLEFETLTKEDLWNLFTDGCCSGWIDTPYILRLIKDFNYTIKALLHYIDYLYTYEALNPHDIVYELNDYARMQSRISNKFDKYPRHFLTTHRIVTCNYNRLKEQFDEKAFAAIRDESLEYRYKNYRFIYPKTTQDIKDEAVQQNHCVASYIGRVINGECHILFMRYADDLEHSLITLEIRNGQVVQAKGQFNRDPNEQELEAINAYNNRLKEVMAA